MNRVAMNSKKMQIARSTLIVLLALIGSIAQGCCADRAAMIAQPTDGYWCAFADEAVVIDGAADEKAWRRASVATDFVTTPKGEKTTYRTTAQLLWSNAFLYVTWYCETDAIRSNITGRDALVFEGEAAEIFICPDGRDRPYFEIDINPQGAVFDSRIEDWRYEAMSQHWQKWAEGYNADVRAAARIIEVDGQVVGWSAEVAIPWSALGRDGPRAEGEGWAFNLFRIALKEGGSAEYAAWQNTKADFHRPETFPRLIFVR